MLYVIARGNCYAEPSMPELLLILNEEHHWLTCQATIFHNEEEANKIANSVKGIVLPVTLHWPSTNRISGPLNKSAYTHTTVEQVLQYLSSYVPSDVLQDSLARAKRLGASEYQQAYYLLGCAWEYLYDGFPTREQLDNK